MTSGALARICSGLVWPLFNVVLLDEEHSEKSVIKKVHTSLLCRDVGGAIEVAPLQFGAAEEVPVFHWWVGLHSDQSQSASAGSPTPGLMVR